MRKGVLLRLLAVAGVAVLTLTSCIDLTTNVSINADGSGTAKVSYTVSRLVVNLGSFQNSGTFFAVPISRSDFENTVSRIKGLTLRSYDSHQDTQTVTVNAEVGFTSVKALSSLFSIDGTDPVTVDTSGGKTTYRYVIFKGNPQGIDADSKKMIESFFGNYHLTFSITAPHDIASASPGSFSGRTATVTYAITDVLESKTPVVWEVSW